MLQQSKLSLSGAILVGQIFLAGALAQRDAGMRAPVKVPPPTNGRQVVLPKWENGYLATFDLPGETLSPSIYLHSADGKQLFEFGVSIPASVETTITDVAVSSAREVAVAGGAATSDGRHSGFIAYSGMKAGSISVVRTWPFVPRRICFGIDGTLWALGWELDATGTEHVAYDVLRQYGRDGKLLKSALPRNILSVARSAGIVQESQLASSGKAVGIYSEQTNEWLEVSIETGLLVGRWPGRSGPDCRVRSVGRTTSGVVYLTCESRDKSRQRTTHKLEPSTHLWRPAGFGLGGRIIGTDGENVVLWNSQQEVEWINN